MRTDARNLPDQTINVELVAELLDARGWSWTRLADEMGMHKSTVSRVVTGELRPGAKFIFRLQAVFPDARGLFVALDHRQAG